MRLLYFYQVGQSVFLFPAPGLDPFLYHQWAESIASGKGMGKGVFQAMPLYPYFLGALYKAATPGLFWAKLVQLLLGAVSVLFVYQIGKTLFNGGVGRLAAWAQAFSGISIFYEELLVPTALISFLFIVTLFCVLRAKDTNRFWDWLLVGFLLGITTLAHAGVLLFLPLLFIWIVALPFPLFKRILTVGMLLASVFLALFAVFFRNLVVAKDPVFLTAHGGVNFYIGNNPGATGRFHSLFSRHTSSEQLLQESKEAAEKELGRALKEGEVSRFWFRKGIHFIRTQPRPYLKLLLRKCYLFWNGAEIADVEDYYFYRSRFPILKYLGIPLGWAIPFSLLGIFVSLREVRKLFLLYGLLLSQMVAILFFFVNSRYRAPLAFAIFLFAAAGIVWILELFLQKRYRTLVVGVFFLVCFVILTHGNVGKANEELQHYNVGIVLDHGGEHEAAIQEFKKALVIRPADSTFLFALANAYFRNGDLVEAKKAYQETLRQTPHHADAHFNLGLLYFHEGRWEEAEETLQKSASLKGDPPDVYYLLSVIYRRKGLLQKSEEAKARAIARGADPAMVEKEPEKISAR